MYCPSCGKEIDYVYGFFEVRQTVKIYENGTVKNWENDIEFSNKPVGFECPFCDCDISDYIYDY